MSKCDLLQGRKSHKTHKVCVDLPIKQVMSVTFQHVYGYYGYPTQNVQLKAADTPNAALLQSPGRLSLAVLIENHVATVLNKSALSEGPI
jgi:hypothetical protein